MKAAKRAGILNSANTGTCSACKNEAKFRTRRKDNSLSLNAPKSLNKVAGLELTSMNQGLPPWSMPKSMDISPPYPEDASISGGTRRAKPRICSLISDARPGKTLSRTSSTRTCSSLPGTIKPSGPGLTLETIPVLRHFPSPPFWYITLISKALPDPLGN